MKLAFFFVLALQFISCGDGSTANKETLDTESNATKEAKNAGANEAVDPNIAGEWLLYYIVNDDNGNRQLDGSEMSNAVQHWGRQSDHRKTTLLLNINGQSENKTIDTKKGNAEADEKGTWKLKSEREGTVLYQYSLDKELEPTKAVIIKLTEQELEYVHIDEMLKGYIYVYKRVTKRSK